MTSNDEVYFFSLGLNIELIDSPLSWIYRTLSLPDTLLESVS